MKQTNTESVQKLINLHWTRGGKKLRTHYLLVKPAADSHSVPSNPLAFTPPHYFTFQIPLTSCTSSHTLFRNYYAALLSGVVSWIRIGMIANKMSLLIAGEFNVKSYFCPVNIYLALSKSVSSSNELFQMEETKSLECW